MNDDLARRALDRIARLACEATDVVSLWKGSTEVLQRAVPHYWSPCWYTLDPAPLLITSHYNAEMSEYPAEWLTHEYFGEDVNHIADVVRSPAGIATLHEATNGDPSQSWRWQENMKLGGDQELILGLRTRTGEAWGALGLYREPGQPMFDAEEKAFLLAASQHWANGVRRALLMGEAQEPEHADSPGLVIFDAHGLVEAVTPGAVQWIEEMPDGDWPARRLPSALLAVASRAESEGADQASVRVRTRSGTWLTVQATSMGAAGRVAVIIEPANPSRIYPLLMAAYGLTERERDVTRLILQGNSTSEIAEEMVVTSHTVQQHLKGIFEKTGVRSRRELVGKVFFAHYEPRLRDNEQRVSDGRPVRGGPKAVSH